MDENEQRLPEIRNGKLLVTIHQPDHLPWLGLMNKIDQSDLFVVLDCVQLSKKVFQHRNRVIGPSGCMDPTWLTVPIATANHQRFALSDIEINNQIDWQRRYKNILYDRYHNHPFWHEHCLYLESLWSRSFNKLIELNMDIIHYLLAALGISTPMIFASSLDPTGSKSELNLSICHRTMAGIYLAGPLSRLYLDEELFLRDGIEVRYHEFLHPTYQQFGRCSFSSHLSTFDLLMNHGNKSIEYIRGGTP